MAKLFFTQENSTIKLWLASTDQKVNSLAGEIVLPVGAKLEQLTDGNSIVSFWVERPALVGDRIIFSGIIPGGYQGEGVPVLSLALSIEQASELKVSQAQLLAHDGLGTAVAVETPTFALSNLIAQKPVVDTIPPEKFTPLLTSDPSIFEGKKFLVFSAQDKQSGISHYEVCENGFEWSGCDWWRTESPYLIINQNLDERIEVKAVDLAGNERIVTALSPPLTFEIIIFRVILILVIILCFFAVKKLFSRR